MSNKIARTILGLSVTLSWTTTTFAAEAEDVIKYRKGVMKSVGGHMAAAAQIVQGKVDFSDDLVYHAESIARSLRDAAKLFPEGSDFGETRALDAIWSQSADFKKVADDAGVAAKAFADVVNSGAKEDLPAKFKGLADACKACHKDFRKEEK